MANEYLKRTPTSTGNRRVFTWSGWIKFADSNDSLTLFGAYYGDNTRYSLFRRQNGSFQFYGGNYTTDPISTTVNTNTSDSAYHRDSGNWMHVMYVQDTTVSNSSGRTKIYVNGVESSKNDINVPSLNSIGFINSTNTHYIGQWADPSIVQQFYEGEMFDVFSVDGQALTPDVFGYYKKGDGYISAGSTQATDFKKGQWVPKSPKVIKSVINARGGFGVNGFYLPMNDSTNFGADFHCEPNSIIKLKGEDLPQPRNGAPETTDAYVSQLRDDPFKDYLVLAIPGISGGKQNGFGDYSADIKGSGSNKIVSVHGNSYVLPTDSQYGSALSFDGSDGTYLSVSNDQDFHFGNGDFTVEFWQNANAFTDNPAGASMWDVANNQCSWLIYQNLGGLPRYYVSMDGVNANSIAINAAEPALATNEWHHIVMEREGSILRGYVNGVVVGINTTLGSQSIFTPTKSLTISEWGYNDNGNLNGFIQDLRIYKGVAKYKGGFDVPKPYTPVGIATWRAVPDTTANNFATMNPLIGATPRSGSINSTIVTYTDGNLTTRNNASGGWAPQMQSHSNFGMTTGKWYWECSNFSTTTNEIFGISKGNEQGSPTGNGTGIESLISFNAPAGTIYIGGQSDTTGSITPASGTISDSPGNAISSTSDVVGFAFDADNSSLTVYLNGTLNNTVTNIVPTARSVDKPWRVTKTSSSSGSPSGMSWNFGQNPTFSGNTTAGTYTDSNGKGLFKYQPPSGFLALCEDNLPTPAISDPGKYFKTVLFRSDGNIRGITGVGFKPDLVWFKYRNAVDNHVLVDSVRGVGKRLFSDLTNAELDTPTSLMSFDDDGFSIGTHGSINTANRDLVVWCWKAGGAAVSNTDGSITSQVSANQTAGFSIVSYTSPNNASDQTVGHGLNKKPDFIIVKDRDFTYNWDIYHSSLGYNASLIFTTAATRSGAFGAEPTSSVFTTKTTYTHNSTDKYIAYCWTEIEGFSKFGSYVGNLSADGPFVYCGFKPAWVLIKRTDTTGSWGIWNSSVDSTNPSFRYLLPNDSGVEQTGNTHALDFLSNGFKIRNNQTFTNASGGTYIFAAFAESPFTTANAK